MSVIDLGSKREVFWDNYLVDEAKTTAFSRMIEPKLIGPCYWLDKGQELELISYPNLVKNDKGYKLYYNVCMKGVETPFVFYDTNPNCLKEEKYKMLAPKTPYRHN